ncbi:MAG: hypothetical protein HC912_02695 [Saprospiraceae bacterium]|nr:hypothetical protein [Saprospiraceae bacterium]
MNHDQYFDEIIFDQYLSNTMPTEQKIAFESALASDAALADALDAHQAMKEDLDTIRTYRQIQQVGAAFRQEIAQQPQTAKQTNMKPIRTVLAIAASLLVAVGIWSLMPKKNATIDIASSDITTLSDTGQGLIPSTWQLATQAVEKSEFIKADSLLSTINLTAYEDDTTAQQKIQLLRAAVKLQLKQCEEAEQILQNINNITDVELQGIKENLQALVKKC